MPWSLRAIVWRPFASLQALKRGVMGREANAACATLRSAAFRVGPFRERGVASVQNAASEISRPIRARRAKGPPSSVDAVNRNPRGKRAPSPNATSRQSAPEVVRGSKEKGQHGSGYRANLQGG